MRVVLIVLADVTDDELNEASGMDASEFRTFWAASGFLPDVVKNPRRRLMSLR